MPRYVRAFHPGGTFFFTAALLELRRQLLIEHIDTLREVMRDVQSRRPYRIDAIVVLPDHLHCLWTLPPDDADFSSRWWAIKSGFSRRMEKNERLSETRRHKANGESGSDGSGNTSSATSGISSAMRTTFTTTRSSTATCIAYRNGRIRAFTGMSNEVFIRPTGAVRAMSLACHWNDSIVGIRFAFPTYASVISPAWFDLIGRFGHLQEFKPWHLPESPL